MIFSKKELSLKSIQVSWKRTRSEHALRIYNAFNGIAVLSIGDICRRILIYG